MPAVEEVVHERGTEVGMDDEIEEEGREDDELGETGKETLMMLSKGGTLSRSYRYRSNANAREGSC